MSFSSVNIANQRKKMSDELGELSERVESIEEGKSKEAKEDLRNRVLRAEKELADARDEDKWPLVKDTVQMTINEIKEGLAKFYGE